MMGVGVWKGWSGMLCGDVNSHVCFTFKASSCWVRDLYGGGLCRGEMEGECMDGYVLSG